MRIRFDITRDFFAEANTAKIEIYNLSKATRATIKKYETSFVLSAGYLSDGGAQVVLGGEVYLVSHERRQPDVVTVISGGEGFLGLRETRGAVSYAPGTPVATVINAVAAQLGIPLKIPPQTAATFPNGFAAVGPFEDILRRACAAGGLEHSIQNGFLQTLPLRASTNDTPILISEATGMIGSPTVAQEGQMELVGLQPFQHIRARCLLNPRIYAGRPVTVQSLNVDCNGTFKCRSVHHVGDTFGDDWYSEVDLSKELIP